MAWESKRMAVSALGLPRDVILGDALISLVGNCQVNIENYRGLLFYLDCFEWASQGEAYYDLRYMALLERTAMRLEQQGLSHAAQVYKDRMEQ